MSEEETPETPPSSAPRKTPYQGTRRCFGLFRCPTCSNSWASGNSWANTGQQCNICIGPMVYPFHQRKLKPPKEKKPSKTHPDDLCEKCIDLGFCCRRLWETEVKKVEGVDGQPKPKKKKNRKNRKRRRRGKGNASTSASAEAVAPPNVE